MHKPWESSEYCGRFGIDKVMDLWNFDVRVLDLPKYTKGVYIWRELRHTNDERVIYVGQSTDLNKRIKDHIRKGSVVNDYIDWKYEQPFGEFSKCENYRNGCYCFPRYKVYLLIIKRSSPAGGQPGRCSVYERLLTDLTALENDLIIAFEPFLNSPGRLKYWMYDTWGTVFKNSR